MKELLRKKFHIAISTGRIEEPIRDYSARLGAEPCSMEAGEYALWRTESLNVSIRQDASCKPGELRHLGWKDPEAEGFTQDRDVNGILWERFRSEDQAEEISARWPEAESMP